LKEPRQHPKRRIARPSYSEAEKEGEEK